jgi:hypothetical protein
MRVFQQNFCAFKHVDLLPLPAAEEWLERLKRGLEFQKPGIETRAYPELCLSDSDKPGSNRFLKQALLAQGRSLHH